MPLFKIFLKDEQGKRPVHGPSRKFQEYSHRKGCPLSYDYFHGVTGAGAGMIRQAGWSGAIARSCICLRLPGLTGCFRGKRKSDPRPEKKR